ncbi:carph-isopro domain-containing protein [Thalassospira xiamenensis]|uniref:carph-isopro domain-containing protein n=1 Tax=Thalassospira xiamenensis TaxID=220697 RepID=UPI003AA94ECD
MKPADRIIDRFGGLHATAKALGHRHVTTVQGWKERGYIPGKQIPAVLKAARNLNIEITLKDFDDLQAEADSTAA